MLRRIMRRAIQQGRVLGIEGHFLPQLSDKVIEVMGGAYPELVAERETILKWVRAEEESFGRTLAQGKRLLEELIHRAKADETSWISAEDAFELHDTYGFPYELTKELLAEEGLSVDDDGFDELMDRAREVARAGGRRAMAASGHERVIEFARSARLRDAASWATSDSRWTPRWRRSSASDGRVPGQARGEPLLPGGRRPGGRHGRGRDAVGPARRWTASTASATTRRWRSS